MTGDGADAGIFFEQHPDPLWVYDVETLRFLDVNAAAVARYGYDREEFLAMTIVDIRPADDAGAVRVAAAAGGGGRPAGPRARRDRPEAGAIIPVDIASRAILCRGRQARLVAARDVTRRVELEHERVALLASERRARREAEQAAGRLQVLFDALPGKVLAVTPDRLEVVAACDGFFEATMTRRDEVLGRPLSEVLPDDPDDGAAGTTGLLASLQRVCHTGAPDVMAVHRMVLPRPPAQGGGRAERFWSTVNTPVQAPDGGIAFVILRMEDVTDLVRSGAAVAPDPAAALDMVLRSAELRAANARLAEQDANLRTAKRLLGLGLWKLDLERNQIEWSDEVYTMYGVDRERGDLTLEGYVSLVYPDDRDAMQANYGAFLASGATTFEFGHRLVRPDGGIIRVRGVGELTRGRGGGLLTGVVQDVTRQTADAERLAVATAMVRIAGRVARLGGWRLDLDPPRLTWSAETCAIHELPEDAVPSLDQALAFYPPEHRDSIAAALAACTTDGVAFDEVLPLVTARGSRIWVRAIGEPVRDAQGRIVAAHGAFQDVSEQVAARDRTAALARRLSEVLENISDAFITFDRQWRFTFVNGRAEQLLDRPRARLLGRIVWEAFPEAAASLARREYERAVETGVTARFTEHYEPLGRTFEVTAYPTAEGLAVYFHDVTERRQAEEAVRFSNERFQLVARATNDVIWDWDLPTDEAWWNESMGSVFGYPHGHVVAAAAAWQSRIHVDDRERVASGIRAVIAGSDVNWSDHYRFIDSGGRVRNVVDRGFVIRDAAGVAIRMIGSMLDVTEQKALEDRLRQSQKLEAVGQLTGGVAHDFNNLLMVILGNAELLEQQLADRPALREMADMVIGAATRGAELTDRLLAFARRQALHPRPVDLGRLAGGMTGLLRRTLAENVAVAISVADGLWIAEVDPGQFEVALLNLAINARDAMPGGGRLEIEIGNAHLDEDYAGRHDDVPAGEYVLVAVTDSGTGMSADVVAHAFEPFFTTKPVGKGSGLGLSMVYGFVKQSGGHVKIYSEPDVGTTIKLYFPRVDVVAVADRPVVEPTVTGGTEHVLVVEDDTMVREHLTTQLRDLGYRVTAAPDGPAALAMLQRLYDVDLLFTDIVMPGGMNGRQLADAAQSLRPGLRVLFTSGYAESAIVHHGRLDPGVALLSKPYRRLDLAAKVRSVLDAPATSG